MGTWTRAMPLHRVLLSMFGEVAGVVKVNATNSSESSHDAHHPWAWSANQHGAFVDHETHQRVVKHGDHFDKVLSPTQSSHLFFVLLIVIMVTQLGLHAWKKYRYRSFQITSLVGLWVLPFGFACYIFSWKFIILWLGFSFKTGQMLHEAYTPMEGREGKTQDKMGKEVPRRVYGWFYKVYRCTYGLAVFGYACILSNIFGLSFVFHVHQTVASVGMLSTFYGLYFGLMGRDCAELCAEFMARSVGVSKAQQKYYDSSRCAICALEFKDLEDVGAAGFGDPQFELPCKHNFHEHCIRGWALVGKKDTCPLCDEKVDMESFSKTPWGLDGTGALWGQLLDAVRYLIVWNPVILVLLNGGLHMFGLH